MLPRTLFAALLALSLLAGCAPSAPAPAPPASPAATQGAPAPTGAPTRVAPSPAPAATAAATAAPRPAAPLPTEGPAALGAPSPTPALPEPTISAQDGDDLALLRTVGWGAARSGDISPDRSLLAVATSAGVALFGLPELRHLRLYHIPGGAAALRFSPGGGLLAVAGTSATDLRRVADGSLLASVEGQTPLFGPDGQTLVTQQTVPGETNEALQAPLTLLWRADGQPVARLPDERPLAFSPDGALLATQRGPRVVVRRSADGASLRELEGVGAAFSPDGKWFALSSPDGADVQLWPAGDLERAAKADLHLASEVDPGEGERELVFSADSQTLTAAISRNEPGTGLNTGALRVWRLADGTLTVRRECQLCTQRLSRYGTFMVETDFPNGIGPATTEIKRCADGQVLSSFDNYAPRELRFSADQTVGVADLELALQEDGVPFDVQLPGFDTFGYTPDAQTLVGAGPDLTLWDVTTGALRAWQRPREGVWEGGQVPPLRYRLLGRVVVAEWDHLRPMFSVVARAWDAQTGAELWRAETPANIGGGEVLAWAVSADGAFVLAQGSQARLFPRAGPAQVIAMTSTVSAVAFSPDGATLAVGDTSGQVQIMASPSAKNISSLHLEHPIARLTFSPDGKRLAATDGQSGLTLLPSLDGEGRASLQSQQAFQSVTFSPDGTLLGLHEQSRSSVVRYSSSGSERVGVQSSFAAGALTFSYDNELLLVAEQSGLAVYRLSDGALLRRLDGAAQSSAIGPRRRLIGLLRDGLVEQWGVGAGR